MVMYTSTRPIITQNRFLSQNPLICQVMWLPISQVTSTMGKVFPLKFPESIWCQW